MKSCRIRRCSERPARAYGKQCPVGELGSCSLEKLDILGASPKKRLRQEVDFFLKWTAHSPSPLICPQQRRRGCSLRVLIPATFCWSWCLLVAEYTRVHLLVPAFCLRSASLHCGAIHAQGPSEPDHRRTDICGRKLTSPRCQKRQPTRQAVAPAELVRGPNLSPHVASALGGVVRLADHLCRRWCSCRSDSQHSDV